MSEEAITISKVKNIIIMLMHAIAKEDINMVDHYLDDSLTAKLGQVINDNKQRNLKQKFGLPNISHVEKQSEKNGMAVFSATIRFCNYKVDRKTNQVVEGDEFKKTTHNVLLHFKHKDIEDKSSYHCPFCGAGININATSICSYCQRPLDERFSEYVLTKITTY